MADTLTRMMMHILPNAWENAKIRYQLTSRCVDGLTADVTCVPDPLSTHDAPLQPSLPTTKHSGRLVYPDDISPLPNRRTRLSTQCEAIIMAAVVRLGAASIEKVYLNTHSECLEAGIEPPSRNAIRHRLHDRNQAVDILARIGRFGDLMVDSCALQLDVTRPGHLPNWAFLTVLIELPSGRILFHLVSDGQSNRKADEVWVLCEAARLFSGKVGRGTMTLLTSSTTAIPDGETDRALHRSGI